MKMIYLDIEDIKSQVIDIAQQIYASNWRPSYIVGITRGGLIPATMLSHYLETTMHTLDVRLRDGNSLQSSLEMAADASGITKSSFSHEEITEPKNILVVDDINDSGATFDWIVNDWMNAPIPGVKSWDKVVGSNVRFASLVNNEGSRFKEISYTSLTINKVEEPSWVVFPWENWWSDKKW